jgi:hypothetical protein
MDDVNKPAHYCYSKYESADVLDEWFPDDPHLWNAGKYLSRCQHKGNLEKDLNKAIWMIKRHLAAYHKKQAKFTPYAPQPIIKPAQDEDWSVKAYNKIRTATQLDPPPPEPPSQGVVSEPKS